jgi:protein required for attachment to host cells
MKSAQKVSDPQSKRIRKIQTDLHSLQKKDFKDEVCQVYDLLIDAGMDLNEAIRKTRSALKAINYPFATYDIVMAKLRASGRLRKHLHQKAGESMIE